MDSEREILEEDEEFFTCDCCACAKKEYGPAIGRMYRKYRCRLTGRFVKAESTCEYWEMVI